MYDISKIAKLLCRLGCTEASGLSLLIVLWINFLVNNYSAMSGWTHCILGIIQYSVVLNPWKQFGTRCSYPGPLLFHCNNNIH